MLMMFAIFSINYLMIRLEWSSECYLKEIYVDGRGYDVDYKDGGEYTITMR